MAIIANAIRRKWWFKWIRSANLFSFKYWWFIWILFLLLIFLIFYCCLRSQFVRTTSDTNLEIIHRLNGQIDSCCDCREVVESVTEEAIDCPDRDLVFQICNENSARDDNFEVFLNDISIGVIDLNSNDQVGSVFIASFDNNIKLGEADFPCPLRNMKLHYFSPSTIKYGENKLVLKNIQNNNNENRGSIGIRNYLNVENVLKDPCVVGDLTFMCKSGESFEVTFNYTKCCE
jgi:hypothetical protein